MSMSEARPQTSTHSPKPLPRIRRTVKTEEIAVVPENQRLPHQRSFSLPRDTTFEKQGTVAPQPSPYPQPTPRRRNLPSSSSQGSTESDPETSISSAPGNKVVSQRQTSVRDSIAEEEDIYTDDNGVDTSAQVGWEVQAQRTELDLVMKQKVSLQVEVDELQSSLARLHVEEEKTGSSIGSLHSKEREVGLKVESLRAEVGRLVAEETSLHSSINSLHDHLGQLRQQEMELNASRDQALSAREEMLGIKEEAFRKREQALTQREHELRMREERFSSQTGDHEFQFKQEEQRLQAWDDMLHMRKKELDHREFDMRNSMTATEAESSAHMAELADRELSLQQHELDLRQKEASYQAWRLQLEQQAATIQEREADLQGRMNAFQRQQQQQQATYYAPPTPPQPTVPPPILTQPTYSSPTFPPPIFSPPPTTAPTAGSSQFTAMTTAGKCHSSTRPASSHPLNDLGSNGPRLPPAQPVNLSGTQGVASGYAGAGHTSSGGYAAAGFTPVTSTPKPTRVIDPDEELAHLLSDGGKLMLSQDEELARQLQEEENQRANQVSGLKHEEEKTALDQDHQLALQLQKEHLEAYGTDLTIENQFGSADTKIKTVLQEKLTHDIDKKEQEKQDLLLAQQLAERLAKGELGSTALNDLNS